MAIHKSKSAHAAGNGSSRSCLSHHHCSSSTYCDGFQECYMCSGCATWNDAIDGTCPAKCGASADGNNGTSAGNNGSSAGNGYMITTSASAGNNGSSAGYNGSSGGNGDMTTTAASGNHGYSYGGNASAANNGSSAGNNDSSAGNGYMTSTAASAGNHGSSAGTNASTRLPSGGNCNMNTATCILRRDEIMTDWIDTDCSDDFRVPNEEMCRAAAEALRADGSISRQYGGSRNNGRGTSGCVLQKGPNRVYWHQKDNCDKPNGGRCRFYRRVCSQQAASL
jgi:hypothetical protein